MDLKEFSPLPAEAAGIVSTGEYRSHQDGEPKAYKADKETEFRQSISDVLATLNVAHLSTVSAAGWPVGGEVRFVPSFDTGLRPVFYCFADDNAHAIANIGQNSRASLETHFVAGFERRRETRAMQFQGCAGEVSSASELAAARTALAARFGAEPGDQQIIRFDALSVVNFNAGSRPQWGTIDYLRSA